MVRVLLCSKILSTADAVLEENGIQIENENKYDLFLLLFVDVFHFLFRRILK